MTLAEQYRSPMYIQCMLYKFIRHEDYVRAAFWLGVADVASIKIPADIKNPILAAHYVAPNLKALLKAMDVWTKLVS